MTCDYNLKTCGNWIQVQIFDSVKYVKGHIIYLCCFIFGIFCSPIVFIYISPDSYDRCNFREPTYYFFFPNVASMNNEIRIIKF